MNQSWHFQSNEKYFIIIITLIFKLIISPIAIILDNKLESEQTLVIKRKKKKSFSIFFKYIFNNNTVKQYNTVSKEIKASTFIVKSN